MTTKSLRGSVLLPLVIALFGACIPLLAQDGNASNGGSPAADPTFKPPAMVVPFAGQLPGTDQDNTVVGKKEQGKDGTVGGVSPFASSDDDYVPSQAPVTPRMSHETVDSSNLYTVHLRPLFSTGIKLPEEVVAIAVGAPSLIWAEHDKNVPRLIFVKPTTNAPVNSNIIVSLKSGETLTIHVISAGEKGSDDPVDFMVDYSNQSSILRSEAQSASMFRNHAGESSGVQTDLETNQGPVRLHVSGQEEYGAASTGDAAQAAQVNLREPSLRPVHFDPANAAAAGEVRTSNGPGVMTVPGTLLESMYQEQASLGAPKFLNGVELSRVYPADKRATGDLAVSLGRTVQRGDTMTFSYSVQNLSHRTIEIMPPHLEFADPKPAKPSKNHPTAISEQLTVDDYILTATKLKPGQRIDGAIQFSRPSFKYRKQLLMLQVASASEVDTALLAPIPFTTPYGSN
jgi:hypothetical protein